MKDMISKRKPVYAQERVVLQFDREGSLVREYQNSAVAALDLGCTQENIRMAVTGKSKTDVGHVWIEKGKYDPKINTPELICKRFKSNQLCPVVQLALSGDEVGRFESIKAAALVLCDKTDRYVPTVMAKISSCRLGKRSTAYGYEWR